VQALFVFVDPESDLGTALSERVTAPIHPIEAATIEAWRNTLGDPATLTADRVNSWITDCLLSGRRMPKLHPKVRLALKVLRDELRSKRKFSLGGLANLAGLSPSRFMHVFTESVGVPLRPYILWLRLQQACSEIMNGATVTEAAHRSGFADAAHLTRTFRRMLGITPGRLVERRLAARAAFAGSS
jgi:AraC-like DNA-binding protein